MLLSADDLVGVLEELQETHPDKTITRDFFRENTEIPDRHWIKHFGTFPEFKRQTGLLDTRSVRKVMNQKAKVSEIDRLMALGEERKEWSDLYIRPKDYKRFQIFVVSSDIHDVQCDPFYRRMFIQACEDLKPQKIIHNGDLIDNAEVSSYSKREYDPITKMKWVHRFLGDVRDASPDSEMNLVEGNHEYRLVAHLSERSPYVMDMMDFNNIGMMDFLGLKQFEMNYYARADFSSFTASDIRNQLCRNYYQFEDYVLFHHFPQGAQFGMPGCSGHHHKFKAIEKYNKTYGPYNWFQTGGGSRRHVDYMVTMGEQWSNGFMIVIIDTQNKKNTIFDYVDCTGEHCFLNGKLYHREPEEQIYLAE
jgi:hypothetical protein